MTKPLPAIALAAAFAAGGAWMLTRPAEDAALLPPAAGAAQAQEAAAEDTAQTQVETEGVETAADAAPVIVGKCDVGFHARLQDQAIGEQHVVLGFQPKRRAAAAA